MRLENLFDAGVNFFKNAEAWLPHSIKRGMEIGLRGGTQRIEEDEGAYRGAFRPTSEEVVRGSAAILAAKISPCLRIVERRHLAG